MSAIKEILKFKGKISDLAIVDALSQFGGDEAVKEILKFKGKISDLAIVQALGRTGRN